MWPPVCLRSCSIAGEVACTGLHGANRLASTSLLEGLVWGCSIGDHLADKSMPDSKDGLAASADLGSLTPPNVPESGAPVASNKALSSAWKELRCVFCAFVVVGYIYRAGFFCFVK